jgi:prepilin-type N-terminal cleavage/methylation domain-containing protein
MTRKHQSARSARFSQEQGFTLIEVMTSMVVLTVGLVSLLAVFSLAMASTKTAQDDMIAKQEAAEAIESIYTARNTAQISWSQVNNVSGGGIFLNGLQSIRWQGADGIDGTADDGPDPNDPACPGPSQCIKLPGADGKLGTADDLELPLNNFQRQIQFTPLNDSTGVQYASLRQITVTVRYTTSGLQKQYVMTAYISQYR